MTQSILPGEQANESRQRLGGVVVRIVFHAGDTGFCVARVKVSDTKEPVTVVGTAAVLSPGETIECHGEWINDRTYGLQFRTTHIAVVPPATLEGIEKYLASGTIDGIGAHFAKALVDRFGANVFDVIEFEPDRLTEIGGIGVRRVERISRSWTEQKSVKDIMTFLHSHGIGTTRAVRIYKLYGNEAIAKISEDPYRLTLDMDGIGFKTADALAQRLGIAPDAVLRIRAGIRDVLGGYAQRGDCGAERTKLVLDAARLLDVGQDLVERATDEEIHDGHLVGEEIDGVPCVFSTVLHRAETGVAAHLHRLLNGEPFWVGIDAVRVIPGVEAETGIALSASQQRAVARVLASKISVITGGPGVGKTTVINTILRCIQATPAEVVLCAPTGRAAKRLADSTGMEAKTIHRLLEFDPVTFGFRRNSDNPLQADLVVIDETSMVDVLLMYQLLRAIPGSAALVIVGDADQLPSVGPGMVLADIIASGRVPVVHLTEIFRQAAESTIVVNAHRIKNGELPIFPAPGLSPAPGTGDAADFYFINAETPEEVHDKLMHVVTERIPQRFGVHPVRDIQVLSPMNRGGLGTRSLNIELQALLNPDPPTKVTRYGWTFATGDKVIQTANDYEKEVFNGDIGTVARIDLDDAVVTVCFDGRDVDYRLADLDALALAYATTVHKAQGSEYPVVVIPLSTQHYPLLQRNLLYTAITRGCRLVVIVGQQKALRIAINNTDSMRRFTTLAKRIADADKLHLATSP
ncbi:MAG: exodeoxyribonuclease V alpha subunit [Gammaproteobacteria bacterium]|nr:MAG: exodeoxyribonuclease V alpha subunit [Gammaproteobacteria bacterium]TND03269.1 MAG: exodeoxyribonuclease V alpha subunit [Gammaproteobacteria bacterium]